MELREEQIHMWIGYSILTLIIFRLLWGVFGTRHARFSSFFPGPRNLINHLRSLPNKNSAEPIGHTPFGALMAFAFYLLISAQAVTGLFAKGEIWYGPYSTAVNRQLAKQLEAFHKDNFDWLLLAIGAHIIAALFYLLWKKQNLIASMITGKKPTELVGDQAIPNSSLIRALLIFALCGMFVYWLIFIAAPPVIYNNFF